MELSPTRAEETWRIACPALGLAVGSSALLFCFHAQPAASTRHWAALIVVKVSLGFLLWLSTTTAAGALYMEMRERPAWRRFSLGLYPPLWYVLGMWLALWAVLCAPDAALVSRSAVACWFRHLHP
jgi:hypothetical protein